MTNSEALLECENTLLKTLLKTIPHITLNKCICHDNIVGTAKYKNNSQDNHWQLPENYIEKDKRLEEYKTNKKIVLKTNIKTTNKKIAIILESPHKEEYNTKYDDIGFPALGRTGKNLNNYLEQILNTALPNQPHSYTYDVILMNAIQYQTSLGYNTDVFRDRIWLSLWIKHNLREDFIQRLKKYKPDIIFNFCTKGNHTRDIISNIQCKGISAINKDFINSLGIPNITFENDSISCNNKCLATTEHKPSNSLDYTLTNFVNNAIHEYINTLTNNSPITISTGPHPSSWKNEQKKLDKAILDKAILEKIKESTESILPNTNK